MTALPPPSPKKMGLVIDLDTCVGCHACAVSCKEWNAGGFAAPLTDEQPYGKDPSGVWFNRVHSYEVAAQAPASGGCGTAADATAPQPAMTLHFPRSCLHCETPACVTVCPTGASYKRAEDGIVLVDEDKCIGCKLCSWACPYGAREYSQVEGVMKKCTLCIDRIYNEHLEEAERQPACVQACPTRARHFGDLGDPESKVSQLVAARGGVDLMPQLGYRPTNKYLPPRPRRAGEATTAAPAPAETLDAAALPPVLRWLDKVLSR
ncbi:4Fe-4S dicluster domain-containing protein [Lysobacter sp. 5GHs7-4]|uniref:4Fe-4S dicluster domain-containing protein n=1 Tax=Lysobacter sp. 5GHs7-4 TaxID=2904253 RepID=UPI00272DCF94|nr:4Fe-4S dicluster domain-containing protein [Lysobacter sp. 5GHs7-4]